MSLSSAAQLVTVDDTGHYIQLDRPDAVIAEIQELLPVPPTAVDAGTTSVGALRRSPAMRLTRRPRRPRRPDRCHDQPVVGTPTGNRPRRPNRHADHQPRRTRRIRRRVPRQRRNLQRRDQPPLRHRLLGSPRRRRHQPRCNAAQGSPTPSSPPTSPLATQPDEPLSKSHSPPMSTACVDGRCVAPRPHRHRRCRVGPRSDPPGARRRPDHLRRLLLRHPDRAPLRRAVPRRPAGDGARRRRRSRGEPRRSTRRRGRLPRPFPRRGARRLRT